MNRAISAVKAVTPWKKPVEQDVQFVPVHGALLVVYVVALVAYSIFAVIAWTQAPEVETFESQPTTDFGPVSLNVTVFCPSCVLHSKRNKLWIVRHSYPEAFTRCHAEGTKAVADQVSSIVSLCRTTDNIADGTGVKVWLGNMTLDGPRATLLVSQARGNALEITTPLEAWHEKTLLLGMTVNRDRDDCTSSNDCSLTKELYLSSMQYDGEVDWGGESWAGGQLHVRMLRFANVYTKVPKQTILDVLGVIGGMSGLLIGALGIGIKVMSILSSAKKRIMKYTTADPSCTDAAASGENRDTQAPSLPEEGGMH
eukprot:TRINITY_DN77321_c0_g1_i1.p1 TRINITY_DN77321_c0_g1~~TRINITY_DN77321_c0_g1_i1.p1  ORF type:complete len:312 (-),score=33.52 TRINITY_DN77321_c0_g1_i1:55-990(-)